MNTAIDCVPCFVRQALEAARSITDDPAIHEQVVREVLRAAGGMDFRQSPPVMAQRIHRHLRELTGQPDPYRHAKDAHNRLAMTLLPDLQARVQQADCPLDMAVRLAIAGNVIDLGVTSQVCEADVRTAVDRVLDEPFVGDLREFRKAVLRAGRIVYLADNAGEIVFDRLLIEQLPADRVVLVVRGGPVINDATLADAAAAKMDEIVEVIDNGSDAPGTVLDDCSEALRERFEQADLIIAKGQGNFETLSDLARPIFFLFKAKCPVIARHVGVEVGTHVLLSPKISQALAPAAGVVRQTETAITSIRPAGPGRVDEPGKENADVSETTLPADLQRCIDFHGHLCPGLVIGYLAARAGMQQLAAERSQDEEVIAVVENDSCAVDAVQVLTGCTFGKGNLFFCDHGKMVFTFALRPSGRAVRLCYQGLKTPDIEQMPEAQRRRRQVEFMLSQPAERLFCIRQQPLRLPPTARIHQSVMCACCGEMVIATRTRDHDGRRVCIPCEEDCISRIP